MSWDDVAGARELAATPALSPDERRTLEAKTEWAQEDRDRVAAAFFGMAVRAADYYADRSGYDREELRSAAFEGLVLGVATFEPGPGRSVALWVMPRVQQEVLRWMHKEGRWHEAAVYSADGDMFGGEEEATTSLSGSFARVLIEQLHDARVLDERDLDLIRMKVEGYTDEEIAAEWGRSSRRIRQLWDGGEGGPSRHRPRLRRPGVVDLIEQA